MRIRHELHYDAAPADVYAMLADPAFRAKVCAAMDVVSSDVSIQPDAGSLSVRIDMVQRTKGVPAFAKKVVGDETRVVQTEKWADADGADSELQIPGKPGHVRGRITLTGDASGTTELYEGEAKVAIPLVGGKLEKLVGQLFVDGMDTEQRVGARWLAGER